MQKSIPAIPAWRWGWRAGNGAGLPKTCPAPAPRTDVETSTWCVTTANHLAVLTQYLFLSAMAPWQTGWRNIMNERAFRPDVFNRAHCVSVRALGFGLGLGLLWFRHRQLALTFRQLLRINCSQFFGSLLKPFNLCRKFSSPSWVGDLCHHLHRLADCTNPAHASTPSVSKLVP